MPNPGQIANTTGTHQSLDTRLLRSRDDILNLLAASAGQFSHYNSEQGIPCAIDTDDIPRQRGRFEETHVHTSDICIRVPPREDIRCRVWR